VVYSVEDGKLHTKRISALEALYYKTKVKRKRRTYCANCENEFVGFFKNDKEILKTGCPECDDYEVTLIPQDSIEYLGNLLQDIQRD
jgi:hypothetical protein